MICTEEEAKEKWCAMVRDPGDSGDAAINTGFERNPDWSRCIASDCMLWIQTDGKQGCCGLAHGGEGR